jgi:hypothetical protein
MIVAEQTLLLLAIAWYLLPPLRVLLVVVAGSRHCRISRVNCRPQHSCFTLNARTHENAVTRFVFAYSLVALAALILFPAFVARAEWRAAEL